MIEVVDKKNLKKVNLVVIVFSILLSIMVLVQQIVLFYRGEVTQKYVICLSIVASLIVFSAIFMYVKNPYSTIMKRVTAYLYFLYYIILLLGSNNMAAFAFVSTILTIYVLYFDIQLIRRASILISLANIVLVIYNVFYLRMNTPEQLSSFCFQLICVIGYATNLFATTYLSNKFNAEKLNNIKEEKEKQQALLTDILNVATVLSNKSKNVHGIFED